MTFVPTKLEGVWRIQLKLLEDERGFFARTYCEKEFTAASLNTFWPQRNNSFTRKRGTLRGLHFQADPYEEIKLIRCLRGGAFDVLADLRPGSSTYGQWEGFTLNQDIYEAIYVPKGIAHGFQALTDNCLMDYHISEFYHPELSSGISWQDPTLKISWPLPVADISPRDQGLPNLIL